MLNTTPRSSQLTCKPALTFRFMTIAGDHADGDRRRADQRVTRRLVRSSVSSVG